MMEIFMDFGIPIQLVIIHHYVCIIHNGVFIFDKTKNNEIKTPYRDYE